MHTLPKRALAVACAAALLGTGPSALAAESCPASAPSTGISVQLDGRNLSFPDAAPEARDGRTFLPVRTVFEAMGAEVSYSPAAQTITAVRDGPTVTMALGGTTATVERSGVTTHIPMDAAPYAHDNRTYVPVRFAAQAFGCAVGWDAGDRTVILIDMEKLVEETLSKYDFTYLEKYLAYGQKYRTGIWDLNADFDASLDMTGLLLGSTAESAPITRDGALGGVMAGGQLCRGVQGVRPQAHQAPHDEGMLAVYRPIDREHAGTADDPIPWVYGMDCHAGKCYRYNGKVYQVAEGGDMIPCTWPPDTPGMWQWEEVQA